MGLTLPPDMMDLLRFVLQEHAPEQLPLLDRDSRLTEDEQEELRTALAFELMERGLREDSEPTEYGLKIERLIDLVSDFSDEE